MKVTDQIELRILDKLIGKVKDYESKHKWFDYIISPLIVAVILLTVYVIKGVYPFGRNTIAYYDMPTQYVPFYDNAWDILHGKAGAFLCWYYGLGVPTAAGLINFVLYPTNLFLYFTSRDNILYALSFLLLVKMVLAAFSMSFYSYRKYGMSVWTICTGILYACSGYVIQYYTNLFFLDYVILFPLIVWSYERLMTKHKYGLFVLFLFLAFIPNFQFGAMVVIYLIIKSYFLMESIPKERKGLSIRLLAFSGIIAALLSAVFMLPAILVTLNSSRINYTSGFNYSNTLKIVYCAFRNEKHFMMYGSEVAVGLIAIMVIKGRLVVKKYLNNIIMMFVLVLPIFLEGINLLWHFGSYKHFPIRFGYMITFEFLTFASEYIKNEVGFSYKIIGEITKILGVAILPFTAYILWGYFRQFLSNSITDKESFASYKLYFVTISIIYLIIFLINEIKTRNMSLIIMVIIQAFCGCYGLIAPQTAQFDGSRTKYLINAIDSHEIFQKAELSNTDRIKSELLNYEPNYGAVIEQPSIGLWAYGIPADTEILLKETMGYHGAQSSIMDEGGTVFSDAVLGIKWILSEHSKDDILYGKSEYNDKLLKCKYTLPFGMVVENQIEDSDNTSFEFNNFLFKGVTGVDEQLIKTENASDYIVGRKEITDEQSLEVRKLFIDNIPLSNPVYKISEQLDETSAQSSIDKVENEVKYSEQEESVKFKEFSIIVPVEGKKTVYLNTNNDFDGELSLVLNDKPMYFSSYLTENSNTYPNTIYTGIISLGSYEDDALSLKIYTTNDNLNGVNIGLLDLDVLSDGIEIVAKNQNLDVICGKNRMDVTGTVNKDGVLFFPVGYSKDWCVKVNGKWSEVKPYINNAFIAVDVKKGDVNIEFIYWPQGLTNGIILSVIGIVVWLILNLIMKRGGIAGYKYEGLVDTISIYGFKAVAIALLVFMYVIPICVKLAL